MRILFTWYNNEFCDLQIQKYLEWLIRYICVTSYIYIIYILFEYDIFAVPTDKPIIPISVHTFVITIGMRYDRIFFLFESSLKKCFMRIVEKLEAGKIVTFFSRRWVFKCLNVRHVFYNLEYQHYYGNVFYNLNSFIFSLMTKWEEMLCLKAQFHLQ